MKSTPAPKPARQAKRQVVAGGRQQKSIQTEPLFLQHLFAVNVRLVRRARKISQEELAHLASLDRTYISSVERRLRNLSIQNIQRLAVALRVEPKELLDPALKDDPRFRHPDDDRR